MQRVNPFSGIGLPRKDLVFWADRHTFKTRLVEFLRSVDNPNVRTLLLLGEYGSGKTHALMFSQIVCDQSLPQIPAVYIQSPGSSFSEFSRKVFEAIGFDEIMLTFDALISKNKERILAAMDKASLEKEELRRLESVSTERIIRRSFPDIDSDLAIVLAQVYNDRNLDLCRAWLMGRELSRAEMSRLNVSKSVVSDENAAKLLGDILKIIISERQQFILLIDEYEDVANLSKDHTVEYLKAFRRLIDQNLAGLKIVIAWTYVSYQQFAGGKGAFSRGKSYEALRDRLQYNVVHLEELKGKDLEEFVMDIISRVYDKETNKLIELKAIEFLGKQIQQAQPRQLNIVLNRAFQIALEKNCFPIDVRLMNEAMKQTGIELKTPPKVA
jgi:hypothetical protein